MAGDMEATKVLVVEDDPEILSLIRCYLEEAGLSVMAALDGRSAVSMAPEADLADVSHNLRTPLTAAQGWLDALIEGVAREDPQEVLRRVRREVLFVSGTLQRLLDLSRWEKAEPLLALEDFPLVEPLMEAAEALEEQAETRGVTLSFEGLDWSWQVRADRGRVREIFQVLLENAVAHGGEGTHLSVSAARSEGRFVVTVRDDGRGIPEDHLPHLTRRFHRSPGGTVGLGLAIADKLARAHGGALELESHPGEGTTARFSLAEAAPAG